MRKILLIIITILIFIVGCEKDEPPVILPTTEELLIGTWTYQHPTDMNIDIYWTFKEGGEFYKDHTWDHPLTQLYRHIGTYTISDNRIKLSLEDLISYLYNDTSSFFKAEFYTIDSISVKHLAVIVDSTGQSILLSHPYETPFD